ncbi:hypothetical protein NQ317_013842 [Molorchus minor]|uniref:Exportin-5 C-terminal domain-containing protein n=1 Tax=Molorchus minor TaxID=1323400 RepID=A0ABQ9J4W4_9CUCU|nr:hypothetical protein NQ317_013842 [Molorchus minor]
MILGPIVRQLASDNSLNGEMAAHIMAAVLNALTLHGQHEANQGSLLTLGAQIYELLRPSFLEVLAVMQQIPGVNPVDLQKLDERISGGFNKFQFDWSTPNLDGVIDACVGLPLSFIAPVARLCTLASKTFAYTFKIKTEDLRSSRHRCMHRFGFYFCDKLTLKITFRPANRLQFFVMAILTTRRIDVASM